MWVPWLGCDPVTVAITIFLDQKPMELENWNIHILQTTVNHVNTSLIRNSNFQFKSKFYVVGFEEQVNNNEWSYPNNVYTALSHN